MAEKDFFELFGERNPEIADHYRRESEKDKTLAPLFPTPEPMGPDVAEMDRFRTNFKTITGRSTKEAAPDTDVIATNAENFDAGQVGFRSSLAGAKSAMATIGVESIHRDMEELRVRIRESEAAGDRYAAAVARQALAKKQARFDDLSRSQHEALRDQSTLLDRADKIPHDTALQKFETAKTFGESVSALMEAPSRVIPGLLFRTLPSQPVPILGAIGGYIIGQTPGAMVGTGAGSAFVEYSGSLVDKSQQIAEREGLDYKKLVEDPNAFAAFWRQHQGEIMAYAASRAGIIGTMDALTLGLSSKIGGSAVLTPRQKIARGLGAGMAGGAGGEAAAQAATDEFKPSDILAEGLLEGVLGLGETRAFMRGGKSDAQIDTDRKAAVDKAMEDVRKEFERALPATPEERAEIGHIDLGEFNAWAAYLDSMEAEGATPEQIASTRKNLFTKHRDALMAAGRLIDDGAPISSVIRSIDDAIEAAKPPVDPTTQSAESPDGEVNERLAEVQRRIKEAQALMGDLERKIVEAGQNPPEMSQEPGEEQLGAPLVPKVPTPEKTAVAPPEQRSFELSEDGKPKYDPLPQPEITNQILTNPERVVTEIADRHGAEAVAAVLDLVPKADLVTIATARGHDDANVTQSRAELKAKIASEPQPVVDQDLGGATALSNSKSAREKFAKTGEVTAKRQHRGGAKSLTPETGLRLTQFLINEGGVRAPARSVRRKDLLGDMTRLPDSGGVRSDGANLVGKDAAKRPGLFTKKGLALDDAALWTRLVDNGYIEPWQNPFNEDQVNLYDPYERVLDLLNDDLNDRPVYSNKYDQSAAAAALANEAYVAQAEVELDSFVKGNGIDTSRLSLSARDRTIDLMVNEGLDADRAIERAFIEEYERLELELANERRARELAAVERGETEVRLPDGRPGWELPDWDSKPAAPPRDGQDSAQAGAAKSEVADGPVTPAQTVSADLLGQPTPPTKAEKAAAKSQAVAKVEEKLPTVVLPRNTSATVDFQTDKLITKIEEHLSDPTKVTLKNVVDSARKYGNIRVQQAMAALEPDRRRGIDTKTSPLKLLPEFIDRLRASQGMAIEQKEVLDSVSPIVTGKPRLPPGKLSVAQIDAFLKEIGYPIKEKVDGKERRIPAERKRETIAAYHFPENDQLRAALVKEMTDGQWPEGVARPKFEAPVSQRGEAEAAAGNRGTDIAPPEGDTEGAGSALVRTSDAGRSYTQIFQEALAAEVKLAEEKGRNLSPELLMERATLRVARENPDTEFSRDAGKLLDLAYNRMAIALAKNGIQSLPVATTSYDQRVLSQSDLQEAIQHWQGILGEPANVASESRTFYLPEDPQRYQETLDKIRQTAAANLAALNNPAPEPSVIVEMGDLTLVDDRRVLDTQNTGLWEAFRDTHFISVRETPVDGKLDRAPLRGFLRMKQDLDGRWFVDWIETVGTADFRTLQALFGYVQHRFGRVLKPAAELTNEGYAFNKTLWPRIEQTYVKFEGLWLSPKAILATRQAIQYKINRAVQKPGSVSKADLTKLQNRFSRVDAVIANFTPEQWMDADSTTLFSRDTGYPGFYSPLQRTLEETIKVDRASPEQWLDLLKAGRYPGIKKEELRVLGIRQFLEEWRDSARALGINEPQMISKDEIIQYVKTHQVAMMDRVLSDKPEESNNITLDRMFRIQDAVRRILNDPIMRVEASSYVVAQLNSRMERRVQSLRTGDDVEIRDVYNDVAGILGEDQLNEVFTAKEIDEAMVGRNVDGATRYSAWRVRRPNEDNFGNRRKDPTYFEMLVRVPSFEGKFATKHFGDQEVVHIRGDERVGADGKKYLFIMEIQSDAHQAGKYLPQDMSARQLSIQIGELEIQKSQQWHDLFDAVEVRFLSRPDLAALPGRKRRDAIHAIVESAISGDGYLQANLPAGVSFTEASAVFDDFVKKGAEAIAYYNEFQPEIDRLRDLLGGSPEMLPFRGASWEELGIKRALLYAVERGVDGIAFATGAQVQGAVGMPDGGKRFYDKRIPDFLEKYLKPWKQKTAQVEGLAGGRTARGESQESRDFRHRVEYIIDEVRGNFFEHPDDGWTDQLLQALVTEVSDGLVTVNEAEAVIANHSAAVFADYQAAPAAPALAQVSSTNTAVLITDQMRTDLLGGQSLYERARTAAPSDITQRAIDILQQYPDLQLPEAMHEAFQTIVEKYRNWTPASMRDNNRVRLAAPMESDLDVSGMFTPMRGENWGVLHVFAQALDKEQSLRHEIIEALRSLNLFTPDEWIALVEKAYGRRAEVENSPVYQAQFIERHTNADGTIDWVGVYESTNQEAVARYLEDPANTKDSLVRKILDRILKFMNDVAEALAGQGILNTETLNDILFREVIRKLNSGEIASRTPNQSRGATTNFSRDPNPAMTVPKVGPDARDIDFRQPQEGFQAGPSIPAAKSKQQIVSDLANGLQMLIRRGDLDRAYVAQMARKGQRVTGQYNKDAAVARVLSFSDLNTVSHEIGHHLLTDPKFGEGVRNLANLHQTELVPIASPGVDPIEEGFSEFMRRYILNPRTARMRAPTFYAEFEKFMANADPDRFAVLRQAQVDYTAWITSLSADSVDATIVSQNQSATLKETIATAVDYATENSVQEMLADGKSAFQIGIERAANAFLDKAYPVQRAVNYLTRIAEQNGNIKKDARTRILAEDDPYKLFRSLSGAYTAARAMLMNGPLGYVQRGSQDTAAPQTIGPSFREALAHAFGTERWSDEQTRSFGSYMASRMLVLRWVQHRPDLLPVVQAHAAMHPEHAAIAAAAALYAKRGGIDYQPHSLPISRHLENILIKEQENPTYARAFELYSQFQRAMITRAWQAGLPGMTDETYQELLAHPDYVPLWRDISNPNKLEQSLFASSAGPDIRQQNNSFRKAVLKGEMLSSENNILNPIESIMQAAFQIETAIAKNEMVSALVDMAQGAGRGSAVIGEVLSSQQTRALQVNAYQVVAEAGRKSGMPKNDLAALLLQVDANIGETTLATIFQTAQRTDDEQGILWYSVKGEMRAFKVGQGEVARDLFNAYYDLGHTKAFDAVLNFLGAAKNITQAGVTLDPIYQAFNWIRDQVGYAVSAPGYIPFVSGARGFKHVLGGKTLMEGSEFYKNYLAYGGAQGGPEAGSIDPKKIDSLRKTAGSIYSYDGFKRAWSNIEIAETASRVGYAEIVYNRGIQEGLTPVQAMREAVFAARDIMDFEKGGQALVAAKKTIPFFGAYLVSIERALGALAGRYNRDVGKLIEDVAQGPTSNRPIWRETEAPALSLAYRSWINLGVLMVASVMMQALTGGDNDDDEANRYEQGRFWRINLGGGSFLFWPKPLDFAPMIAVAENAYKRFIEGNKRAASDLRAVMMDLYWPPLENPLLKTVYGIVTNYDTFRQGPIETAQMRGMRPEDRYNLYTSEFSKGLGAATGMSPAMIDYVITTMGATMGRYALQATDWGAQQLGLSNKAATDWRDYIMVNRVIRPINRSTMSAEVMRQKVGEGGEYAEAAGSLESRLRSGSYRQADELISQLPENARTWAILKVMDRSGSVDMHPMGRAQAVSSVLSGILYDAQTDRLRQTEKGRQEFKKPGALEKLSPQDKLALEQHVREIQKRELSNGLKLAGEPGWDHRDWYDVEMSYAALRERFPTVFAEMERRVQQRKIVSFSSLRDTWPEIRGYVNRPDVRQDVAGYQLDEIGRRLDTYKRRLRPMGTEYSWGRPPRGRLEKNAN